MPVTTDPEVQAIRNETQAMREKLRAQQTELAHEAYLVKIYQQARNSKQQMLKRSEANDRLIESTHADVDSCCNFVKDDKFAQQFLWTDIPAAKTDKEAEARDKQAFEQFCKANRYNAGIAGFHLSRELLGYGQVSGPGHLEAVHSRRLRLAPASAEELEEREAERLDQEKLRMMSTPAHKLREEAAQGILDRRQQAKVEEADRSFAAKQEAEVGTSYPDLPEFLPEFLAKRFGNQRLDRSFLIKKADRETFKYLHQKFGVVAVENRLRGN